MQNVVLVLLSVLIIIVIAIVFVGYKKMSALRMQISKVQLDVLSLRNFIDERGLSGGYSPQHLMRTHNSLPVETHVETHVGTHAETPHERQTLNTETSDGSLKETTEEESSEEDETETD